MRSLKYEPGSTPASTAMGQPVIAEDCAERSPGPPRITVREAACDDLTAVNEIIKTAIMSWEMPERVKRLSLPIYRYTLQDLQHLSMFVAEDDTGIIGVAACEQAHFSEIPVRKRGVLLHGIYVQSGRHRQGVGTQLLCAAYYRARRIGADGLLVKAHSEARGFFSTQGLRMLPVIDPGRDYPYRFWTEMAPGCYRPSGRTDAKALPSPVPPDSRLPTISPSAGF